MVMPNLVAFLGVAAVVIVTPGPDTALTIRNTLIGGRRGGVFTGIGVAAGQAMWTLATSAGVSALLVASEPVFEAVRFAGALYLVFLGLQGLRAAARPGAEDTDAVLGDAAPALSSRVAFRQGLLSNLTNPKMIAFFGALLPQFAPHGHDTFAGLLALGLLFSCMTLVWLSGYAFVVAKIGDFIRRRRVRRLLELVTGLVLIALGLRLATESG
jgi:threonine/homoserine/homoserine lactone efflux protein